MYKPITLIRSSQSTHTYTHALAHARHLVSPASWRSDKPSQPSRAPAKRETTLVHSHARKRKSTEEGSPLFLSWVLPGEIFGADYLPGLGLGAISSNNRLFSSGRLVSTFTLRLHWSIYPCCSRGIRNKRERERDEESGVFCAAGNGM